MNMALDVYARTTVPRATASLWAMEVTGNTMGLLIGARQAGATVSQVRQALDQPIPVHTAEKPIRLLPFDAAIYDEMPSVPVFS